MSAARPAGSSPAACSAYQARRRRSPPPSTASRWRAPASPAGPSGSASGPRSSAALLGGAVSDLRHRAARGDRARVRPLGVLLAVRPGHGDGRRPRRRLDGQGADLDRLGLLITVIGNDPIWQLPRFTFGSDFIGGGFPFLPVLIGIFAFSQIMIDVEKLDLSDAASRRPAAAARAVRVAPQGASARSSAIRCCCSGRPSSVSSSACCRRSAAAPPTCWPTTRRRNSPRPGAVRHRHAGRHHRLGILEQRQCRRLARHHHGLRHPGRRGHGGDARRDDHPRHPVRAALRLAAPAARLRHLCRLYPGPSR